MELKENNKIDEINDEIISPSQQDAENDKTISLSQQSADIKHLSMSIDALIKTNSDNIKNQDQAFYLENSDYF
jgi:50S ribosomal subunit-associated GTPase HflX